MTPVDNSRSGTVFDCPDLTTAHGLNEYLTDVDRGDYEPCRGTVGHLLMRSHPSTDDWTACRQVARFARLAYRRGGLWWPLALAADPDTLGSVEEITVDVTWRQWLAGDWPGGRRHVAR